MDNFTSQVRNIFLLKRFNFILLNNISMSKQKEFLSLKNNMTLENRLLFLRIGISIVGTLILLFLIILIFGSSLQSKAVPAEPTSNLIELASIEEVPSFDVSKTHLLYKI